MSYEKPIMEIIYFEPIDVITGSANTAPSQEEGWGDLSDDEANSVNPVTDQ